MESFHRKPNRNIRTRENSWKVATKNILVSFDDIPNIVCFFDWSSIIFHKKFFLHICEDVTNVMRKVDNKVEWFPKFCQTWKAHMMFWWQDCAWIKETKKTHDVVVERWCIRETEAKDWNMIFNANNCWCFDYYQLYLLGVFPDVFK